MHDFGDAQCPFTYDGETALVPIRFGDEIDRDAYANLARNFQGLGVDASRGALAMCLQPFLVDRFEAEEHVFETEAPPIGENLLAAAEHVGAGLQIVIFPDFALFELAADGKAMLGMDEGDVIDDEDVALID